MQEIEILLKLNDQQFRAGLKVDDKDLVEIMANAKNIKLGYDNSLAKMKLSEVRAEQARLKAELQEKIKMDVNLESINETKNKLLAIEDSLDGVVKKEREAGSASGSWGLSITGINQGLELARKAWEMLSVPIQKAGQFEQYEVSMKVMLGSTEAAQKRLAELVDFAKNTPFELPQVVEAANQLQAIGKYSEETLTDLGDLASASGKPMEQALSAFAKMATGQKGVAVDMFRDLLISVDDWTEATGKGVKATGELEASAQEMLEALPKIIKEKNFAGMMEEQSKTFNGAVSNMSDGFGQLLTVVGDKMLPFAKSVAGAMNEIVSAVMPVESSFDKASITGDKLLSRFEELSFTVKRLGSMTQISADQQSIYNEAINDLEKEYPKYLEKMDLHKMKQSEINVALDNAKIALDKYIENLITAALIEDNEAIVKDLGRKKRKAEKLKTQTEFQYNQSNEAGTLEREAKNEKQTVVLSGNRLPTSTEHEILSSQRISADKQLSELNTQIKEAEKEIADLRSQLVNTTAPQNTTKNDDGKGGKNGSGGSGGTGNGSKKDYLKETQKDIEEASRQEILTEQAKNQTIYDLSLQQQEKQKALLQAAMNLNKDSSSEKLINERDTAQQEYDITTKLLEAKIQEHEKFLERKAGITARLQEDNDRESFQIQLKNQTIEQLDSDLLKAKIDKTVIEEGLKNASDAAELDSLEKQRANTAEKIALIQSELDKKRESALEIDTLVAQHVEMQLQQSSDNQLFSTSYNELTDSMLAKNKEFYATVDLYRKTESKEEKSKLLDQAKNTEGEIKALNAEKSARHAVTVSTIDNYAKQFDASRSFADQAKQAVRENIKAEISKAIANQIAWVIDVIPFPLNIIAAPLAGLAIGQMMEVMIPKFESGGYPTGQNSLVQVNESGQEFILNATATKKYSGIIEDMNAGTYEPNYITRSGGSERTVYVGNNSNLGFELLAEKIMDQTDRLEKVERYVRVSDVSEQLNNYKFQQSKAGF